MHTLTDQAEKPPARLAPLPAGQRIEALDVVRGFALLGICVMNIEFFNRAMSTLGRGMPAGLTGLDWAASYFVAYFVAGKFWTIFSLLFGMGFAVMLTRAEQAGRSFLKPYMRRIAALAAFGAAHHIFLFAGDILVSYAVAAAYLLVVLYARTRWLILAIAVAGVVACIPGANEAGGAAAFALAFSGLVAIYLRSEKRILTLSASAFAIGLIAVLCGIAVLVFSLVPGMPVEPRGPLTAAALLFAVLAILAQRFREPVSARPWRAGVAIFMLFATMQLSGGLYFYFKPAEAAVAPAVATAPTAATATAAATPGAAATPAATAPATADAKAKASAKPKTAAEKKAEAAKEKAERLKKQTEKVALETKVMSSGSYVELVNMRAKHFAEHVAGESGFATLLIGMFLLGTWFIRSGVMENTAAHLPLFRKFAYVLLPLGIGLGIAGSLIATSHQPGVDSDGFMLADSMKVLGNLPACLGYVGMVVLMLHSRSPLANIKVLAPFGRMALSNYLMQSLIMSLLFLGHGMALYGMGRAAQLGVAACLLTTQIAFSHLWLANFRYGPAEWLWRAITYMTWPPMRIERGTTAMAAAA